MNFTRNSHFLFVKFKKLISQNKSNLLRSQFFTTSLSRKSELVVELRSDTFSKPSAAMRKAMTEAVVGDDVYREDPTMRELETLTANLVGKEAALFVPSGTMGNLISILVHCERRGAEILTGDYSHVFMYQQGGVSQFGGVHSRTLTTKPDGSFNFDEIRNKVRPTDIHKPTTALICVENTNLRTGGQPLSLEYMDQIGALKKELGLPLHMDGARMMNAAVYHKVSPAKIAQHTDTLCFCLSKGLGCPIGSMIGGTTEFINKAIRLRKALGGGMRQTGILAAAGIYALKNMINRLEDDHQHAKQIGSAIHEMNSKCATLGFPVKTNIVFAKINPQVMSAFDFCQRLRKVSPGEETELGKRIIVMVTEITKDTARFVTHVDVTTQHVNEAVKKIKYVIKEMDERA